MLRARSGWPDGVQDWRLEPLDAEEMRPPLPAASAPVIKVTSGSTGTPRGVSASPENVCADEAALYATMGLRDDDVILASIPMAHSYGFSSVALPALLRGLAVAVPDGSSPLAPLDVARQTGATFVPTVPAYLQGLVALRRPELWPRSVRLVVSAGALLPPATAAAFREIYGQQVHCFLRRLRVRRHLLRPRGRCGRARQRGHGGGRRERSPRARAGLARGRGSGGRRLAPPSPSGTCRSRTPGSGAGSFRDQRPRGVGRRRAPPAWTARPADQRQGPEGRPRRGRARARRARRRARRRRARRALPPEGNETVRAVVACQPGTLTRRDVVAFCRSRLAEHKVPRSVRLVAGFRAPPAARSTAGPGRRRSDGARP